MEPAKDAVAAVAAGVKKVTIGAGGEKKDKKGGKKPAAPKAGDAASPKAGDAASSGPLELEPPPAFLQRRVEMFERLKAKYDAEIAGKPRDKITITMPDGTMRIGTAWETTPGEIARGISNSLYKRTVVARLDGDDNKLWDLDRPLETSCKLELLSFDDPVGQQVFWHSSAHILGEACERRFGCSLCIGPPVENGFYYEMALPDGAPVQTSDWDPLENIVGKIVKDKQKFERLVLSKEDLLEMFSYNKYKQHIIMDKIPDGTSTTVYRNGPLIDLCRGPHVPDTSRVEAFSIMKNSASYFLGNKDNDSLQRIYGVSFPDKKRMVEHKKFLEEAAKRDHRKIGKDQELFFFHEMSPGSAMWLPHGTRIYNTLLGYIRDQYWKRDYQEVITPNMYNSALWKQSGHWDFYQEDMFIVELEKEKWGLKPMNCPGHALMFAHRERSHRELPWRVADFGVLHRNEASGALSGMTRVRRFQQDDAHIFCREDQIRGEVDDLFDFLKEMYGLLGFTFRLNLSTRPDKFMGDVATWDRAEAMLRDALDEFTKENGTAWVLNEGDGAFYGPKIDIQVFDCLNRPWQTATIQLDFMQPQNFSLEYQTSDPSEASLAAAPEKEKTVPERFNFKSKDPQAIMDSAAGKIDPIRPDEASSAPKQVPPAKEAAGAGRAVKPVSTGCARPVMIHRAMCGSIERFTAILCEHFGGKWPFWLSPRQILIVPVGKGFYGYANEIAAIFKRERLFVDVDTSGNTLQKKVRTGQLAQYNFIFVVGNQEMEGRQVNARNRDDPATQERGQPIGVDEAVEKLRKLRDDKGTYNPFPQAVAKPAEKK